MFPCTCTFSICTLRISIGHIWTLMTWHSSSCEVMSVHLESKLFVLIPVQRGWNASIWRIFFGLPGTLQRLAWGMTSLQLTEGHYPLKMSATVPPNLLLFFALVVSILVHDTKEQCRRDSPNDSVVWRLSRSSVFTIISGCAQFRSCAGWYVQILTHAIEVI